MTAGHNIEDCNRRESKEQSKADPERGEKIGSRRGLLFQI
jgi:hypothetical protein